MSGRASGRMYPDDDHIKHFRASKADAEYAGLDEDQRYVEVRYERIAGRETDADGCQAIDEIVTAGLHLEMMSEDACWMDVNGLHVWLRAVRVKGQRKLRLVVTCFANSCKPVVVKPGEEAASSTGTGAGEG